MRDKCKQMYAIYSDAIDGGVWAAKKPQMPGTIRLCTVAAHDAVEAFDIFIALEGIDYDVPSGD